MSDEWVWSPQPKLLGIFPGFEEGARPSDHNLAEVLRERGYTVNFHEKTEWICTTGRPIGEENELAAERPPAMKESRAKLGYSSGERKPTRWVNQLHVAESAGVGALSAFSSTQ